MKRRRLTRLQRVRIFDAAHGRCILCGLKINASRGEAWEVAHRVSLWAGGTDTPDNMGPAHRRPCHRGMTDSETPARAKETRQRASFLGIKGEGQKLPCGRDSPLSKTLRGEVVARRSGRERHREAMEKRYGFGEPS